MGDRVAPKNSLSNCFPRNFYGYQSGDVMGKRKDLTGKIFGRLTVLKYSHTTNNKPFWECRCECGNIKSIRAHGLTHGTRSCGCINIEMTIARNKANGGKKRKCTDFKNLRFGRLVAIKRIENNSNNRVQWECLCDCGEYTNKTANVLAKGDSKSCGCIKREILVKRNQKHNLSKLPEYKIWKGLRTRCNNPNTDSSKNYNLRGIKVCDRWSDFKKFYEDMGIRPTPGHTIERKDNDGNYEPDNCIWIESKDQGWNTRRTLRLTHNGETKLTKEWAETTGLSEINIRNRITNLKWSVEKTLTTPLKTNIQKENTK